MEPTFYVHIIESPSPEEIFDGATEGKVLCSFLDIAGIPYVYHLAVDEERFAEAMTTRISTAIAKMQLPPILHLSVHGNEHGIQLMSQRATGDILIWQRLASYIHPLQSQIPGGVGICLSACQGANGQQMAHVISEGEIPFPWIVGCPQQIDLRDAALGFSVFYRRVQKLDLGGALPALRAASGIDDFQMLFGQLVQQKYSEELRQSVLKLLHSSPYQQFPFAQPFPYPPPGPYGA